MVKCLYNIGGNDVDYANQELRNSGGIKCDRAPLDNYS